jgi:hypothetical protein
MLVHKEIICSRDSRDMRGSKEISPRRNPPKSVSIKKLESEGGLQQTEFFDHQVEFFDRSQFTDVDVSFMCLRTIKQMEEKGAFNEAQSELGLLVHKSITPHARGMACLLLAELFNKWGAASASYTIDVMERGFFSPLAFVTARFLLV